MSELVTCHVCGEVAKYRVKRLCARCYQRLKRNGDLELHTREQRFCIVDGCDKPVKAYDLCVKHWRRVQAKGDVSDGKWDRRGSDRCSVPGCGGEHRSMGLCEKHYTAEQRRGHPLWRTIDRAKVHGDRPWTPETVIDHQRLINGWQHKP